jgi:DNA oxidative demethylase
MLLGFQTEKIALAEGVWLMPARVSTAPFAEEIAAIVQRAPYRSMQVPGGKTMSVVRSNCGECGWVTDTRGYRYERTDPLTREAWPPMPERWRALARELADECKFADFAPDSCMINRYGAGHSMGLHQDIDELDFTQPIVSLSLGDTCSFQLGGLERKDSVKSFALKDGDVLVWGGVARKRFHGVRPFKGEERVNLTFRRAF